MARLLKKNAITLVSVVIIRSGCAKPQPADLVLRNGTIVTVNERRPEAQAIAVKGDVIVAVGSNAEVERYVGIATTVIDLEGKLAIPGFIEGHGHFTSIGSAKMNLELMNIKSWDAIVAMVEAEVKKKNPGEWILGRGWHQEKWMSRPSPNVEGFPVHASLSSISPNNPVLLTHASGHASFANAKALQLSGITHTTQNPSGGEILKDARGQPTGLLRETAQGLVRKVLTAARAQRTPEEKEREARKEIELAAQECLSKGVTSFHDAGSSFTTIDLFRSMVDAQQIPLRLWVMVRDDTEQLIEKLSRYRMINYGDHRLTVRAIKRSIDGALGPRGAWLLEPYSDLPTSTGLNLIPVDEMKKVAGLAIEQGYQFCVHAIGDRANRETLNIIEEVFQRHPEKSDLRWRVEHAQHLHPDDISRFAALQVIASMQGIHCTSDAPYVVARLGEKRAEEGAYVWQRLMKSGAVVINGTDAPVEDVNPILSFYASISRRIGDGSTFFQEQRMTRHEALRSYTIDAAYAAFEDEVKGSLVPGKLADIVVLSKNIMSIPEDEIPAAEVFYTIVGGKLVYQKK